MTTLPGLDLTAFAEWAANERLELSGDLTADLVAGGRSCLTYVVTDSAGRRVVVRRPPLGQVLESAHNVVREHRIVSALAPTDVPVAPTLGVCDDPDVIGARFFVMDYVDGGVLHELDDVADVTPTDEQRRAAAESMLDALVALHAVDVDAVGLGDLAKRTGFLDRQLKRWSAQLEASRTRELPEMDELHRWLVAHQPAPSDSAVIVHGDFRIGNALLGADGRVAAMVDWELTTFGEPMADLAYLLRSWGEPDDPPNAYRQAPTCAGGFPTRAEMARAYGDRSGRSIDDLSYWMAFNAWRSAAIAEGVLRRYVDGQMGDEIDLDALRQSVDDGAAEGLAATR